MVKLYTQTMLRRIQELGATPINPAFEIHYRNLLKEAQQDLNSDEYDQFFSVFAGYDNNDSEVHDIYAVKPAYDGTYRYLHGSCTAVLITRWYVP